MRHTKRARIRTVQSRVAAEISALALQGRIAAVLAAKGYLGGYRDALDDVLLFLGGVDPKRNCWWDEG